MARSASSNARWPRCAASAGAVSGQVALGMMPTIASVLAGPLARRVALEHPGISLRIVEGYTGHLIEWVQRGVTDATLLYGPAPALHLRVTPLLIEEMVLVGAAGSGIGPAPVAFASIAGQRLVLPSRQHGLRRIVEAAAGRAGIALNVAFEADSFGVLKELVESGLGQAVLPRSAIRAEEAAGRLAGGAAGAAGAAPAGGAGPAAGPGAVPRGDGGARAAGTGSRGPRRGQRLAPDGGAGLAMDYSAAIGRGSTASSEVRTTIAAGPGERSAASSAGKSALLSTTVTGTRKAAHHWAKSGLIRLVPETRPGWAFSWWMRMLA